jgi:flagellar hook-associated protein 2
MASTVGALDSSFISLINSLMTVEKQPLTRLTTQRDEITVQKGLYSDLSTMLSSLQSSVKALRSTDALNYSLKSGRTATVTSGTADTTVLKATASSTATPGQYEIAVDHLAASHRIRSDAVEYNNQPLNMSGSFVIGGAAEHVIDSSTTTGGVLNFGLGTVDSDQTELGSDAYTVETRSSNGVWEYRLVNADGEAVSIREGDSEEYTTSWQKIPTGGGVVDTGRGLTFEFDSNADNYQTVSRATGASTANYTAKGATVSLNGDNSLIDLAYNINHASYADGNRVTATIVNNQLILTNERTGAGRNIVASDSSGTILNQLGILNGSSFKNVLQTSASAVFTVNNLPVTRSKNSELDNVIQGVTISLASDAAGKSATIDVAADTADETKTIKTFVDSFNSLQTYLTAKTTTIKQSDGTYQRGALSGDSMFYNLRMDLLRMVNADTVTSGIYKNLKDIGLTLGDDLKLTISDSDKLTKALVNNKDSVTALLDTVMGKMDTRLGQFTGTSGYLTTATKALESQLKNTNSQITTMNERLAKKEESLYQQYGELQAQLYSMSYTQQQLSSMFSSTSS